jgi:type III restriction enzyme
VARLRYVVQRGEQRATDPGAFSAAGSSGPTVTVPVPSQVAYDLIGELAERTRLTRRTVASILRRVSPATFAQYRQNPGQFISESARLINDVMGP